MAYVFAIHYCNHHYHNCRHRHMMLITITFTITNTYLHYVIVIIIIIIIIIIIMQMKRFSSGGCYADITPKERAIVNGQRSFVSFLLLQLFNSFLRILAVPNKAVLCKSPVLIVTPSFSSHASNLLLTTPSVPTTTGTTYRCLIPHSLPISLLRS